MDRNSLARVVLISGLLLLGWYFFFNKKPNAQAQGLALETYIDPPGFAPDAFVEEGKPRPPEPGRVCTVHGPRFEAELSSHGAGLTHFVLTDAKYQAVEDGHPPAPLDMSTTPDLEMWRNLRTQFRAHPGTPIAAEDQVSFDRFDWDLTELGGTGCRFAFEDPRVRIEKTVRTTGRPFELTIETTLTNRSDAPKKHETSLEIFAYRRNKEVKGKLGRVSPFLTNVECARHGGDVQRKSKDDDAFRKPPFWFELPLGDRYAGIANYYFAQAIVPLEAAPDATGDKPACGLLVEQWYGPGQEPDDDRAGDTYHARLAYPERTLAPGESATYRELAFFGPKERGVLAQAGGGWPGLADLINLGTFSVVAKVLVTIIAWIHAHLTGYSWGLAIIVLTLGLRLALFPLTWKQIMSTVAMRRLKPEVDALNEKFKDDAQAKNLAMMELWRKHKVNPLGGCLPALVQMPIWFALYATLQTAVEFYHTHFLWFRDLSAPDPFYVLPLVLGGIMIIQQRIVPQQGMDPVQQKIMMWLMPAMFTVMMLFLPAALGVYMLTNSALGITQQLVIERLFPAGGAAKTAKSLKA